MTWACSAEPSGDRSGGHVNEGLTSSGSSSLFNPNVPGLEFAGRYGANRQHTMFYIVDANDGNAVKTEDRDSVAVSRRPPSGTTIRV